MNKKEEMIADGLRDAANKLTVSLESVFSSLENFRLASLEEVKAIGLMGEKIDKLIKTTELLSERLNFVGQRIELLELEGLVFK